MENDKRCYKRCQYITTHSITQCFPSSCNLELLGNDCVICCVTLHPRITCHFRMHFSFDKELNLQDTKRSYHIV